MQSNDTLFSREFKEMMNGRRSIAQSFNLVDLPLPSLSTMITGIPRGHMALIRGMKELFFNRLNGKEVQLVGRTTLQKRQVLSDGSFRKNKEGQYEYTQVPVSRDCVAILTPISIGLKRFVEVDGVKKEHKPSQGFRYVDYVETNAGRKYIYIVPKNFVYRLNMCALVLTPNKRRTFYKGCKLALQNGSYVYLYVIPFKYRESLDLRVLGVKSSFNFDDEVRTILQYWMHEGIIFNLHLTQLENQVNGVTNLGILNLEGTCVSEDYRRFGVSLADEKESEFQSSLGIDE